ncbi:homeobox protein Hox-D12a [Callorhinchus milii]|uniref:Homeobox protein HoxD12 n=1 Tax=Callorhinchus milii TaxID=7868 RepID=C7B9G2_CALMI|nr:homeobox protein Hox-D12a [Callorhinchus milii]ACU32583.1 homeobox protein HoxD12 [Callorhinchus milii]|eukprot:gi/632945783/ref/XP_007888236.1/ PREDICTED: homeobox protein Hox-D12 [Callorhinchus milii]
MCEHNLLNSGYVGSLLNFPSPEPFYFPNLRPNGAQLSALSPALSYSRREVCALPWTSPSPCASPPQSRAFGGYSQSYLSNPVSISRHGPEKAVAGEETGKYYFQDSSRKLEERCRQNQAYPSQAGIPYSLSAAKYEYSNVETSPHGSSLHSQGFELNSNTSTVNEGIKQCVSLNMSLQSSIPPACNRSSDGMSWCPTQVRSRKKRKPYTKPQIAELENEFLANEFINRQKRKDLSDRLNLSDQQVKIWFQNRRMKKKRLVMREHTLSLF